MIIAYFFWRQIGLVSVPIPGPSVQFHVGHPVVVEAPHFVYRAKAFQLKEGD